MDIAQAVNVGSYGLAAVALYTQCRMLNLEDIVISTVEDNINNCSCRVDATMFGTRLFQAVGIWLFIAIVKSCEDGNASGSRQ